MTWSCVASYLPGCEPSAVSPYLCSTSARLRAEGLCAPLSSQRGSQGEAFSGLLFERNTSRHHGSRILPRQSAWGRGRLCVGGEGLARKDVMWWGIPGYRCRIPRCHSHALQMLSVWERALRNEPCRPLFPGRPRPCCQSHGLPGCRLFPPTAASQGRAIQ